MALHGSATIELINDDGSKEVIKHDNIITNAPNDLLKGYNGDIAPICKFMKSGDNFMQELFGGILLFSDVLDSDAANYFIPNGKIVGYASQDAYAGLDTARGSYNESESGAQNDGSYRFVWDFSTAQGNGTIKALALCPNRMGQIGLSATIAGDKNISIQMPDPATPFNTSWYMLSNTTGATTNGISNYNYMAVAVLDDIVYAIDIENVKGTSSKHLKNNGGILKLYRFRIGATKISALACVGGASYIDSVDVTLPSGFVSQLSSDGRTPSIAWSFIPEDGKILMWKLYDMVMAVGASTKYVEIDLKNGMNVISHSFTNNTAGYIQGSIYNVYGFKSPLWIGKTYIVTYSKDGDVKKFYAIKRNDNTNVRELKDIGGNVVSFDQSTYYHGFQAFFSNDNNVVVFNSDSNDRTRNVFFLDLESGIIQKTNATTFSYLDNVSFGSNVLSFATGNYLKLEPVVNPFVLCTKNNLDTAVTKTASQTMKITYTLTESEKS